jgi:hypothetical protein
MPEKFCSATEENQTTAEEQKAGGARHSEALVSERTGAKGLRTAMKVKIQNSTCESNENRNAHTKSRENDSSAFGHSADEW